jgi:hypothetical protein
MYICTGCKQYRPEPNFVKGTRMFATCAKCRGKRAEVRVKESRAKRPRDRDQHEDAEGSTDDSDYAGVSKQPRLAVASLEAGSLQTARHNVNLSAAGSIQPVPTALQDGTSSNPPTIPTTGQATIGSVKARSSSPFEPSRQSSTASLIDESFVGDAVEGEAFGVSMRPAVIDGAPLFKSERSKLVESVPSSVESHWASAKKRSSVFSTLSLRSMSSRPSFSNMLRLSRDGSLGAANITTSKASIQFSLRSSTQTIFSRLSSLMAAPMGTSHDEELLQSRGETDSARVAMSVLGPTYNNKRMLRKEMFRCAHSGNAERLRLILDTGNVNANDIQGPDLDFTQHLALLHVYIAEPDDVANMTPLDIAVHCNHVDVVRVLLASQTLTSKTLRDAARKARPYIFHCLQSASESGRAVDELSLLLTVVAVAGTVAGADSILLIRTAVEETHSGLARLFQTNRMLVYVAHKCSCRQSCEFSKSFRSNLNTYYYPAKVSILELVKNLGNIKDCKSALFDAFVLVLMLAQHDREYPYKQALVKLFHACSCACQVAFPHLITEDCTESCSTLNWI